MNAIAIRTNNLDVWEIVARNYPTSINNYKLFLVVENKLNVDIKKVKTIADNSGLRDFNIINSTEITSEFEQYLVDKSFLKLYKGNTILLMARYIRNKYNVDKLLMLEEDILLSQNFDKLFNSDKHCIFDYDGNIARDKSENTNNVWKSLFGKDTFYYTPWTSPMLLVSNKINDVEELNNLVDIYETDYFVQKAKSCRAWHLSYFDQTALGMLYYDRNDYTSIRNDTGLIIMGSNNINYDKIITNIKNKSFVHICCKSKLNILRTLVNMEVLK